MADLYIPNLDIMMIYRLDRFGRGGHHRPFNAAGIPGVRIMETNENYVMQHQDLREEDGIKYGDTIDGVDFDYAAKLTNLNAVVMAGMAWAPNPPVNVQISGAVQLLPLYHGTPLMLLKTHNWPVIKFTGDIPTIINGSGAYLFQLMYYSTLLKM